MPYIEVEIDTDDFLASCNNREIENVITYLEEAGDIPSKKERDLVEKNNETRSSRHLQFLNAIYLLSNNYDVLSNEETDLIFNLAKKYTAI